MALLRAKIFFRYCSFYIDESLFFISHFIYFIDENSLEELIEKISDATAFYDDHLKLYDHSDFDRERNLLKIWTDEGKKMTLKELGFQPGQDYQIDADNYPEAANPPVKIETQATWNILMSGGPMLIGPHTQGITLDRTSWVSCKAIVRFGPKA